MNERNNIRPDNASSSPSEKSAPLGEHQPIEADAPALSAHGEESNADREADPAAGKQAKVRVEYKHSLATRWMHWINFPLLFVMIYSGILIYWADSQHEGLNAHHVLPRWTRRLDAVPGLSRVAFFMWFFALMGLFMSSIRFLSVEWRNLISNPAFLRRSVSRHVA